MKIKIELSTGKIIELTREEFIELTGQPLYIPVQTYPVYPTYPRPSWWYSTDQTTTDSEINLTKRPKSTIVGWIDRMDF